MSLAQNHDAEWLQRSTYPLLFRAGFGKKTIDLSYMAKDGFVCGYFTSAPRAGFSSGNLKRKPVFSSLWLLALTPRSKTLAISP